MTHSTHIGEVALRANLGLRVVPGERRSNAYKTALSILERTVDQIIRDLTDELDLKIASANDPNAEGGGISALLKDPTAMRPVFRSKATAQYMRFCLDLADVDRLGVVMTEMFLNRDYQHIVITRFHSVHAKSSSEFDDDLYILYDGNYKYAQRS